MYRPSSFSQLPEIVKNLLIINGLFFLATISLESYGIDFTKWFALHQFQSPDSVWTRLFRILDLEHHRCLRKNKLIFP